MIEEAWHLRQHANMWRMTDDLWDNWEQLKEMFGRCELWQRHVGDCAWPDCDMLPLGYIGEKFGEGRQCRLSHTEQETMFTLWCIFRSPLMLGSDLPRMDAWTKALVTNSELLGIHQHGVQPRLAVKQGDIRVWLNENRAMGQRYQAVFNLGDEDCRWEGISLKAHGCRLMRL